MTAPGLSWGPHTLEFELPTGSIHLNGLSDIQRDSLITDYRGYINCSRSNSGNSGRHCQAYRLDRPINLPIESMSRDQIYTPIKIRNQRSINLTGYNFAAEIQLEDSRESGSLGVFDEDDLPNLEVIENYLRVAAAHSALEMGGLVFHSAGLVMENRAYIFTGRSGSGKTTLTRKAHQSGATVLSDDLNLLLPREGKLYAHAVPFTGEFGRTLKRRGHQQSYPVAGIVLLDKGNQLDSSTVRHSAAVAGMMTGCPFVNTDDEESARLFDTLTAMAKQVPVLKLTSRIVDQFDTIMKCVHDKLPGENNAG